MKKSKIYLFILVPILAFSGLDMERVNSVLSSIKKIKDKSLTYYTTDKVFLNKLKVPKAKSPKKADIILFPSKEKTKQITIVNSYTALKKNKSSIGAIYVKKGRTQIIFVEERLKEKGLKLPEKYKEKYLIQEACFSFLCLLK